MSIDRKVSITKISQSKLEATDLISPIFGKVYSDHMLRCDFKKGAWQDLKIIPYADISISPANSTLHYAATIFEGLKAYRNIHEEIVVFRLQDNAKRMMVSAARMCMPVVPESIFMTGISELLKVDENWITNHPGTSLYIRPFQIAMDPYLGIRPSDDYTFMIITGPVGAYYSQPLKVKIETNYARAVVGGTGFAKTGGNYAAALKPALEAQKEGYDQLIWTDAVSHEYIEESGTMNIMFIIKDILITAPIGDTILNGITRDSILTIAKDQGMEVEERPIAVSEIIQSIEQGNLQEVFGVGTAATVAPIKTIGYNGVDYELSDVESRKYSLGFLDTLDKIKSGVMEDKFGWIYKI